MGRAAPFITAGLEHVGPVLGAVAASPDALPPLKSAVSAALWIIGNIKEFRSKQDEWVRFSDYVAQSTACVAAAVSRVGHSSSFEADLEVLSRTLNGIGETIEHVTEPPASKSRLKRLGTLIIMKNRGQVSGFRSKLDSALALFNLGTTVEARNRLTELLFDTNTLVNNVTASHVRSNEQRRDASASPEQPERGRLSQRVEKVKTGHRTNLNLLKRVDAEDSWENPSGTCLPGTRADVIHDTMQFASATTSSSADLGHRILLIVGVAGCGKSALAQSITQECAMASPKSILGSSFVFTREVAARSTPDLLFSTIAHDISSIHPTLADAISDEIGKHPEVLSSPPPLANQFRTLLLLPLMLTARAIPHPIVITIDALDEGANDELLDVLASDDFAQLPSNCRFIITSRPDARITLRLRAEGHVAVRDIELNDPRNLDDVAFYARHTLAKIPQKRSDLPGSSWPSEKVITQFIRKAEGLFLWVATSCRVLLSCADPTKQLERLIKTQPMSGANVDTDAKMARLYSSVVLASCPWEDDAFAWNYQPLMGTILALKTPLSPVAIKTLLNLDSHVSVIDILRSFNPVLTGTTAADDAADKPLQIRHETFRDFAGRRKSTGTGLSSSERRYAVDVAEHGHRLALFTLLVLNHELQSSRLASILGDITAAVKSRKAQDIPPPRSSAVSEALWYSCRFFPEHLAMVVEPPDADLLDALREFLEKNLSAWLVLCAAKGSFQGVTNILAWATAAQFPVPSMVNTPRLARLLSDIAGKLAYMRRYEEALEASREVVDLRRHLAEEDPSSYLPELAMSLNNLSSDLSHMGHREEALEAIQEAVSLHRQLQLSNDLPATFNSDLAVLLSNLSADLSHLKHTEEALDVSREVVALRRQLAQDQPAVFKPAYAMSLNNLSSDLSKLEHHDEALVAIRESVAIYRELVKDPELPTATKAKLTPDLALALDNLSNCLSDLNRLDESLEASREAVDFRRELLLSNPASLAYRSDLASSLTNLASDLNALDHKDESLEASREALELYRQLAKDRPATYTSDLAKLLHTMSNRLSDLDHPEEALEAAEESVELYRHLARARGSSSSASSTYSSELARSLHTLSNRLAEASHKEEALEASQEAVDLRRRLLAKEPSHDGRRRLARSLDQLARRLERLHRRDEADEVREEAKRFQTGDNDYDVRSE